MRNKRPSRLSMSLVLSLFICIIFLISAGVVAGLTFIGIQLGVFDVDARSPLMVVFNVLLASVLVGTLLSLGLSRIPLRPIRLVIAKVKELAGGNFDAHLDIRRPPEFHQLAESFNSMARELGSIEMLRSDFVNNFSHEFKTPIVSIKGFAELLKYGDLTEAERNEYLDIVISESARLAELSTNVLYLSKIENQEILTERASFALGEQIRHTILLLQSKWEEKHITMNIDLLDLRIVGGEEMLGQVWLNLIDNAIKFTPEGGTISLTLMESAGKALFRVQDTGCGIEEEAAGRIFDRFYQADTSHATSGNGLGLTLVQKIVRLHKGEIRCESRVGKGTVFWVELPLG